MHSGAMKTSGIEIVASENSDFDKVEEVKRIWLDLRMFFVMLPFK